MKKKILLKALIPLTTVGVTLGVALPLVSCSCSPSDTSPSDYVGRMDGTDWKGYGGSGTLVCTTDTTTPGNYTVTYVYNAINFNYVANNLVIPDTVSDGTYTYKVIAIDDDTFNGSTKLTGSLTIGNNVASIGNNAFEYCAGLTGNLTIGNNVTNIGTAAFNKCTNLTGSLTIPNSVTTIDVSAFDSCTGLTGSLTIGNNVTTIGTNAFVSCAGFTAIVANFNGEPSVGNYAFKNWASSGGTVKNNDGSYNSATLLALLQGVPQLPNSWRIAA